MRIEKMRIIVVLLILMLGGCSKEPTVAFSFEVPEVEVLAVEALKEGNIWFAKKSDGRYEFKKSDVPRVQEIYFQASNSIIPFGRGSSHGPEMQSIFVRNLNKVGAVFEIRRYKEQDWIVWEESQAQIVKEAYEVSEKELHAMLAGEDTHNKSLKSGTPKSGAP